MTNSKFFIVAMLIVALSGCKHHKQVAMGPIQLPVADVVSENVAVTMEFSGQIYGYRSINIDARVGGYLRDIAFREGSFVRQGQLLYSIEAAPFAAQTMQSDAAVKRASAALVQAQQNYDRVKPLSEFNAASRSDLDAVVAQLSEAKATLVEAKAALTSSVIEQGYTRITSPVNGIIGKTNAQTGAFVGNGSSILTLNTVSQVDSVKVDFYIPETLYTQLMTSQNQIRLKDITLLLSTGEKYPYQGRFNFIGREVQAQTGALNVEVVFPNPDTLLRPGGFALVSVVADTLRGALLIPQKAINQIQGNDFVYILGRGGGVTQKSITSGRNVGNMRVVTTGLSAGEQVITEGFHKLMPGVKVEPQAAPKAK